jgi:hypothetical protein
VNVEPQALADLPKYVREGLAAVAVWNAAPDGERRALVEGSVIRQHAGPLLAMLAARVPEIQPQNPAVAASAALGEG